MKHLLFQIKLLLICLHLGYGCTHPRNQTRDFTNKNHFLPKAQTAEAFKDPNRTLLRLHPYKSKNLNLLIPMGWTVQAAGPSTLLIKQNNHDPLSPSIIAELSPWMDKSGVKKASDNLKTLLRKNLGGSPSLLQKIPLRNAGLLEIYDMKGSSKQARVASWILPDPTQKNTRLVVFAGTKTAFHNLHAMATLSSIAQSIVPSSYPIPRNIPKYSTASAHYVSQTALNKLENIFSFILDKPLENSERRLLRDCYGASFQSLSSKKKEFVNLFLNRLEEQISTSQKQKFQHELRPILTDLWISSAQGNPEDPFVAASLDLLWNTFAQSNIVKTQQYAQHFEHLDWKKEIIQGAHTAMFINFEKLSKTSVFSEFRKRLKAKAPTWNKNFEKLTRKVKINEHSKFSALIGSESPTIESLKFIGNLDQTKLKGVLSNYSEQNDKQVEIQVSQTYPQDFLSKKPLLSFHQLAINSNKQEKGLFKPYHQIKQKVRRLAIYVEGERELTVHVNGYFQNEQEASAANSLLVLLKLTGQEYANEPLAQIWKTAKIKGEGKSLALKFVLNHSAVDQLLDGYVNQLISSSQNPQNDQYLAARVLQAWTMQNKVFFGR